MSKVINIKDNVYWVGVNDRETDIFEALWPLPDGISYNSYLIVDEKVVLVDTVGNTYSDLLIDNIESVLGDRKIDYLIINHMEPDHSGSIRTLKAKYPGIQIIGNQKTASFLNGYYGIQNIKTIEEGDTLDLGEKELEFFITPMLHWPETMMTYEKEDKILFSGDAFGSFGALDGGILDSDIDLDFFEDEIRRYFSNIVGKYSPIVQKTLPELADIKINIVASTRAPIW